MLLCLAGRGVLIQKGKKCSKRQSAGTRESIGVSAGPFWAGGSGTRKVSPAVGDEVIREHRVLLFFIRYRNRIPKSMAFNIGSFVFPQAWDALQPPFPVYALSGSFRASARTNCRCIDCALFSFESLFLSLSHDRPRTALDALISFPSDRLRQFQAQVNRSGHGISPLAIVRLSSRTLLRSCRTLFLKTVQREAIR